MAPVLVRPITSVSVTWDGQEMIAASTVDVTSTARVITVLASVTNARISRMESFVRSVNLVSMETQLKVYSMILRRDVGGLTR